MLNELIDFGDAITLVPQSGVQFVEYGFDKDSSGSFSRSFIERPTNPAADTGEKIEYKLIPNWDDDYPKERPHELGPGDEACDCSKEEIIRTYLDKWVPVPFLRIRPRIGTHRNEIMEDGPVDWVRVKLIETREAFGDTQASHRVVFAFDTTLVEQRPNRPYLAPSIADAQQLESFRMAHRIDDLGHYISRRVVVDEQSNETVDQQSWLNQWLLDLHYEAVQARRPNRQLTDDDFPNQMRHLALYMAYVGFLAEMITPAKVTLIDNVSENPKVAPVDVDLVLDIGNSRSCGLLIQSFPNDSGVDLNRSLVLELRDLSNPVLVYRDPFESHVELIHAEFGAEERAKKSNRSSAFFWPSLVRVGPEAGRVRSESEGTEAVSGLSSPKRYLWDSKTVSQSWRYRDENGSILEHDPLIQRTVNMYVNDRGDVLEQLEADRKTFSLRIPQEHLESAENLRFSRSSFFTFMLVEIIAQAMMMMNSPGTRRRDREKDAPRRLRSIVLTVPSATPVQEQRIIRSRTEAAIKLLWSLMEWKDTIPGCPKKPIVHTSWDEASSVHLVYLYGEITQKLGGNIEKMLDIMGKERPRTDHEGQILNSNPEKSLRIASVDIGGGTTDLMVTTYYQQDNRALIPVQNFREGFRRAGDDLLKLVIERMVIPAIEKHLINLGMSNSKEMLQARFADDSPGMFEADKHLRRQFMLRLLRPVALGVLSDSEEFGGNDTSMPIRLFSDYFDEDDIRLKEGGNIIDYLQKHVRMNGCPNFAYADIEIIANQDILDECILAAFGKIFANIAEAIYRLDVDVVLLTGRPSCLPGVINLFRNEYSVANDRIVSLRDYRVGNWYPFRKMAKSLIDDPKTTAVVGGMLCSLSAGQLPNFTLYTDGMTMRSTARYIGEINTDGIIRDNKVYFQDVDLDNAQGEQLEKTVPYYAQMSIGYRQLNREDWVASPLYRVRMTTDNPNSVSLPISLTLERMSAEIDEEASQTLVMNSEATKEEFVITEAEDKAGNTVRKLMSIEFNTSPAGSDGIYWLDSGILTIA